MQLKINCYSVLIVSSSDKFTEDIASVLSQESSYGPINYVKSISEAQRETLERAYDIVIINSPLSDDVGLKFAIDTSSENKGIVLLFIKSEYYADVSDRVRTYGVLTLRKPSPRDTVSQALDWVKATRERIRLTEQKTMTLKEKMEEIKVVNRAKWILIDTYHFSEQDAHRYIEKQAMDQCVSKKKIAETIIQTCK